MSQQGNCAQSAMHASAEAGQNRVPVTGHRGSGLQRLWSALCLGARTGAESSSDQDARAIVAGGQANKQQQQQPAAEAGVPCPSVAVLHVAGPMTCSLQGVCTLSFAAPGAAEPLHAAMQQAGSNVLRVVCRLLPMAQQLHAQAAGPLDVSNGGHASPGLQLVLPSHAISSAADVAANGVAQQPWLCAQPTSVTCCSSTPDSGASSSKVAACQTPPVPSLSTVARALHVLAAHDPCFAPLLAEVARSVMSPAQHAAPQQARQSLTYSPQGFSQHQGSIQVSCSFIRDSFSGSLHPALVMDCPSTLLEHLQTQHLRSPAHGPDKPGQMRAQLEREQEQERAITLISGPAAAATVARPAAASTPAGGPQPWVRPAKSQLVRSQAVLSEVPCIVTLLELQPQDGSEEDEGYSEEDEGEAELRCLRKLRGRVLLQNEQSLAYWGKVSSKSLTGARDLLSSLFQQHQGAVLELLDQLEEQRRCFGTRPVLERLVWKKAVQVPSVQLGLGKHGRAGRRQRTATLQEGIDGEEGDEGARRRHDWLGEGHTLLERDEEEEEEAGKLSSGTNALVSVQERPMSLRHSSRPSSQSKPPQGPQLHQEGSGRPLTGLYSDAKRPPSLSSSKFLSDSQVPELLQPDKRSSNPLRQVKSASRAQASSAAGGITRAATLGHAFLPPSDAAGGGDGGIGGRHVASMLAQLSLRSERSPMATPSKVQAPEALQGNAASSPAYRVRSLLSLLEHSAPSSSSVTAGAGTGAGAGPAPAPGANGLVAAVGSPAVPTAAAVVAAVAPAAPQQQDQPGTREPGIEAGAATGTSAASGAASAGAAVLHASSAGETSSRVSDAQPLDSPFRTPSFVSREPSGAAPPLDLAGPMGKLFQQQLQAWQPSQRSASRSRPPSRHASMDRTPSLGHNLSAGASAVYISPLFEPGADGPMSEPCTARAPPSPSASEDAEVSSSRRGPVKRGSSRLAAGALAGHRLDRRAPSERTLAVSFDVDGSPSSDAPSGSPRAHGPCKRISSRRLVSFRASASPLAGSGAATPTSSASLDPSVPGVAPSGPSLSSRVFKLSLLAGAGAGVPGALSLTGPGLGQANGSLQLPPARKLSISMSEQLPKLPGHVQVRQLRQPRTSRTSRADGPQPAAANSPRPLRRATQNDLSKLAGRSGSSTSAAAAGQGQTGQQAPGGTDIFGARRVRGFSRASLQEPIREDPQVAFLVAVGMDEELDSSSSHLQQQLKERQQQERQQALTAAQQGARGAPSAPQLSAKDEEASPFEEQVHVMLPPVLAWRGTCDNDKETSSQRQVQHQGQGQGQEVSASEGETSGWSHVQALEGALAQARHASANVQGEVLKEEEGSSSSMWEEEVDWRWHEVQAVAVHDPVSGAEAVLLLQADVTARMLTDKRMATLTETQLMMLESMFPRHVLEFMVGSAAPGVSLSSLAHNHDQVTILFMDIVGFTSMSKEVAPHLVMQLLNELFSKFDHLCDVHSVYKVETAGDCYIVAGALMVSDDEGFLSLDHAADPRKGARNVVEFAQAMLRHARTVTMPHNQQPTSVRIGIHTGSVVSGLIGNKLPKFSLFGDTMNTASRMESSSQPGCIQISQVTHSVLDDDQRALFSPTGGVEVKGKGLMATFVHRPTAEQLALRPEDTEVLRALGAGQEYEGVGGTARQLAASSMTAAELLVGHFSAMSSSAGKSAAGRAGGGGGGVSGPVSGDSRALQQSRRVSSARHSSSRGVEEVLDDVQEVLRSRFSSDVLSTAPVQRGTHPAQQGQGQGQQDSGVSAPLHACAAPEQGAATMLRRVSGGGEGLRSLIIAMAEVSAATSGLPPSRASSRRASQLSTSRASPSSPPCLATRASRTSAASSVGAAHSHQLLPQLSEVAVSPRRRSARRRASQGEQQWPGTLADGRGLGLGSVAGAGVGSGAHVGGGSQDRMDAVVQGQGQQPKPKVGEARRVKFGNLEGNGVEANGSGGQTATAAPHERGPSEEAGAARLSAAARPSHGQKSEDVRRWRVGQAPAPLMGSALIAAEGALAALRRSRSISPDRSPEVTQLHSRPVTLASRHGARRGTAQGLQDAAQGEQGHAAFSRRISGSRGVFLTGRSVSSKTLGPAAAAAAAAVPSRLHPHKGLAAGGASHGGGGRLLHQEAGGEAAGAVESRLSAWHSLIRNVRRPDRGPEASDVLDTTHGPGRTPSFSAVAGPNTSERLVNGEVLLRSSSFTAACSSSRGLGARVVRSQVLDTGDAHGDQP